MFVGLRISWAAPAARVPMEESFSLRTSSFWLRSRVSNADSSLEWDSAFLMAMEAYWTKEKMSPGQPLLHVIARRRRSSGNCLRH